MASFALGPYPEVDAVVIAHPGGIDFPADFERCTRPCLFLCAEFDPTFSDSDRDGGKEILAKTGIWNKFVIYKGTVHGFAVCKVESLIDECRQEETSRTKSRQRPWLRQKTKPWRSLESFYSNLEGESTCMG
jgi:dienelactone hydrolase